MKRIIKKKKIQNEWTRPNPWQEKMTNTPQLS